MSGRSGACPECCDVNKKLAERKSYLRRAIISGLEEAFYAATAISGSSMFTTLWLPARGSSVRSFMRALWS